MASMQADPGGCVLSSYIGIVPTTTAPQTLGGGGGGGGANESADDLSKQKN